MRRPNYSAVTGVTAALAGVCALRVAFQSLIPPPNPDIAKWGKGEFVERAKAQDIQWRPLGPEAFAEAQRLSRPIFLVVGVPWSGEARRADEAFLTPEVARALNRGFVPIRIDGAQDPRWISQFAPLQRTRSGFSVGFQGWVFDLHGRLLDFVGKSSAGDVLDGTTVLNGLLAAQSHFADAALSDDSPPTQESQLADAARLLEASVADLSLANASRTLVGEIDPVAGNWSLRGTFLPRPLAYRFLQLTGQWEATERAFRLTLLSSQADWLDGGFYRLSGGDAHLAEYDKPAVANAQLAEALAVQDAARPNPVLRRAARRTVDWLLGLGRGDLLPSAEAGDESEQGRSRRASFSPRRLGEAIAGGVLDERDREWAEGFLSLKLGARLPIPTPEATTDPRLERVLRALRRAAGPARTTVAAGLCDANGAIAACLLRCARLWNDRKLAIAAGSLVDELEAFHSPSGVRHSLTGDPRALPYLGDALAYADAQLEDFLTNGRVPSLDRGAAELRRALRTFGGPEPGILRPSPAGTLLMPGIAELPQVTDDEREALSATALRLADAYATILGSSGVDLSESASNLEAHLGAVADAVPAMGGALCALARHDDPRAAFVVGSDAPLRAAWLARRLPNRLVVPVLGSARPDLVHRPPGIYIVAPTGVTGPFDEPTVIGRLPSELEVGL